MNVHPFKCLPLFLFILLIAQTSTSQESPWNLGLEQYNSQNQTFSPWYKTFFFKKEYQVLPDSSTRQEGRYSVRIRYAPESPDRADGQFVNSIPIDVPCKKLGFSFYAKLKGETTGVVSFLLSKDRGEKKYESTSFKIQDTTGWVLYTGEFDASKFSFPLDHLRITAVYGGTESMWLDNFTLLADGKPIQEVSSFCKPVNENIQPLSQDQVTRLALLGQIWGFLKYYHPEVAKGNTNWDFELIRAIPVAKNAASNAAFSDSLLSWINGLGPVEACRNCTADIPKDLLTYNIDLAWMKDQHLSTALQHKLQFLLANRHKGPGHYANIGNAGQVSFINEQEYWWRNGHYPNEHFRLLTLYRYWNMIQYFSPYKNIIGRNWNEVLYEYIPRMATARDSLSYNTAVLQLISSVNDSHAYSYNAVVAKQYNMYLPVLAYPMDEKLVVTTIYNDSLAALAGLQKGDIIEKVNGRTIKELIEERKIFAGASNQMATLRFLGSGNYLTGGTEPTVQLTIRKNGATFTRQVQRYPFAAFNYQYKNNSSLHKILPGNIGYVNMGLLEKTQVDSLMQVLKDTRAIIFDIRNYPRGTMNAITAYLHEKPVTFARITQPDFDYPGAFRWAKFDNSCGPTPGNKRTFVYTGKIIILVNEYSQSHAEWTAMGFQSVPGCVTFGSQTSGADGNVARIVLPGGYVTNLTGLGVFYPDNSPTQRQGVRIDKIVRPTPAGITAGSDEVLDAALEYVNSVKN
ncbi:hypothetical protein D3H65_18010 [Paraflavitalea soli]|uniref:Peptidase S41 n=1 Tax=Paraflavitalea soli TaxID=2315862 RepID=A0A3B7MZQ4_9BACT|nr:S41 family peptidase [Paraflavitalea soli]AXY75761.1 hypothetical protein D3H65_18010 [Paraflavitalea soli]